jgi:hypothetical protein
MINLKIKSDLCGNAVSALARQGSYGLQDLARKGHSNEVEEIAVGFLSIEGCDSFDGAGENLAFLYSRGLSFGCSRLTLPSKIDNV